MRGFREENCFWELCGRGGGLGTVGVGVEGGGGGGVGDRVFGGEGDECGDGLGRVVVCVLGRHFGELKMWGVVDLVGVWQCIHICGCYVSVTRRETASHALAGFGMIP